MVKNNPNKRQSNRRNLFDRAKIEFLDYDQFLNLFAQCSKYVVSDKVDKVKPFPKIIQLSTADENCQYSPEFLRKLKEYFDNTIDCNSLAYKIVISAGGKTISDSNHSKRNLAKKRMLLIRILDDAILKAESKYREKDKKNKNSKKLYAATLRTSMLTYPPGRISIKRFSVILSKLEPREKDQIENIYQLVDGYYCRQKRVNKNNWKEISEIFFNLKHLSYATK